MAPVLHLFSPLRIGNLELRNRVAHTPTVTLFSQNGVDTHRNLDHNVALARGGVGLIVTGNRLVHPTSTSGMPRYAMAWLREAVSMDRRMTDAVRGEGTAIVSQLNHFGLNAASDAADDLRVLLGPSPVRTPAYGEIPKEIEPAEMVEIAEWWARCAELQLEGGFDGVEVHMAHTYLLHQFLSPMWNKREDEYGGSLENRMRFPLQVVRAVRDAVGAGAILGVRLSLTDWIEDALDLGDAIEIARALASTGAVHYLDVTAAGYHNLHLEERASDFPDGWLIEMAAELKAAVPELIVFVGGGLKDPVQAASIIADGKADVVAITRALLADPDWARKAAEGREDEIVHCIRCNQACVNRLYRGFAIGCTINPVTGRNRRFGTLLSADPERRWLVVGGGPSGLKAAEILARRGHSVTLLEREPVLGGQVNLILRTPGRTEFGWLVSDLERALARADVDVRLGTVATPELIQELAPDGVVLATGSEPSRRGFSTAMPLQNTLPGADRDHVLTVWDVLLERRPVGRRVVLLDDDGTRYAAGTAEVLLDRGCEVEVVTPANALFAPTATTQDMAVLYARLFEKGLTYRLNSWASGVEAAAVRLVELYTGTETREEVDTVVLATAPVANDALYHELRETVGELHRIGDCVAPRKLDHAIFEGYLAGCEAWAWEDRTILEGELERP